MCEDKNIQEILEDQVKKNETKETELLKEIDD